ncbi:MAG TPA: hypothetical protein VGQ16_16100 [Vicinamibacterales bacterium]|jgi:hypothetical protein|nr:hypothetical protein [Vicinamibacterales bacterium]
MRRFLTIAAALISVELVVSAQAPSRLRSHARMASYGEARQSAEGATAASDRVLTHREQAAVQYR